ncbi:Trans-acting T-cell-specific transcription factor GATA-3, partial [Physocladia obscura]
PQMTSIANKADFLGLNSDPKSCSNKIFRRNPTNHKIRKTNSSVPDVKKSGMNAVSRVTLGNEICFESEESESPNDWSTKVLTIDRRQVGVTTGSSRESIKTFYNDSSVVIEASLSSEKATLNLYQIQAEIKNLQPATKYFGVRQQIITLTKVEASNGVLIEADQFDAYEYLLQSSSEFGVKHHSNTYTMGITTRLRTQAELMTKFLASKEEETIDLGGEARVQQVTGQRRRAFANHDDDDDGEFRPELELTDAASDTRNSDSDDSGPFYHGQKGGNARRKPRKSSLSRQGRKSDFTSKRNTVRTFKKQRPKKMRRWIAGRACSNCNTTETPVWRRSCEGKLICNACGVFAKAHGHVRPIELRKDIVYTRTRKSEKASD